MEQQPQPTSQTEKKYVSKLLARKDIDEKDELDLVNRISPSYSNS